MVNAFSVLIAGEIADFAGGFLVEPVAVGVEVILNKIFVPGDLVLRAKPFDALPGRGFDFEALDV